MVVIENMEFSGFPGRDQDGLRLLTYAGRVAWFRHRFKLVFFTPFRRLVALEGPDCYTWLCVMNLAGSAIEALANLCVPRGQDHQKVNLFLDRYFEGFRGIAFQLDDPRPERGEARTAAEHFTSIFEAAWPIRSVSSGAGCSIARKLVNPSQDTFSPRDRDRPANTASASFPGTLCRTSSVRARPLSMPSRTLQMGIP